MNNIFKNRNMIKITKKLADYKFYSKFNRKAKLYGEKNHYDNTNNIGPFCKNKG